MPNVLAGGAFGRCSGCENRALNGISGLIREASSTVRGHSEDDRQ